MKSRNRHKYYSILIFLGIIIGNLQAYSNGPPNGRSGAPGELTCQNGCHSSFALNSGSGSVVIENAPTEYSPGETYLLTVHVMHPTQHRWGFELCARTESNGQGGTISVVQPSLTTTGTQGGITYLKQISAGTFNGQTSGATWNFSWTAPAESTGPVTFYASGNAANGNGNTFGDYIYTTSFTSDEMEVCVASGDVNFDMNVDVLDIVTLVGAILGTVQLTTEQICAADMNGDGNLDVLDIVSLVNIIVG
ncbi:MAG: choice-of-anchor V domain-containing protein [Fidelibacterota bacterium]